MKAAVKTARKLKTENKDEALKQLAVAYKAIDKAAKRGVIKKGAADRKKIKAGQILGKVKIMNIFRNEHNSNKKNKPFAMKR